MAVTTHLHQGVVAGKIGLGPGRPWPEGAPRPRGRGGAARAWAGASTTSAGTQERACRATSVPSQPTTTSVVTAERRGADRPGGAAPSSRPRRPARSRRGWPGPPGAGRCRATVRQPAQRARSTASDRPPERPAGETAAGRRPPASRRRPGPAGRPAQRPSGRAETTSPGSRSALDLALALRETRAQRHRTKPQRPVQRGDLSHQPTLQPAGCDDRGVVIADDRLPGRPPRRCRQPTSAAQN